MRMIHSVVICEKPPSKTPRKQSSTIFYDFDMSRPGSELVTSHSPKQTLYRATGAGKRYYTQVIIDENIL